MIFQSDRNINKYLYSQPLQSLDEVFYGKKKVIKIQRAMDDIADIINEDNHYFLEKSKENKALEKAIEETFGFKSVHIIWTDTEGMGLGGGPCTIPECRFFYLNSTNFDKHTKKNIVYNDKHDMRVTVFLDNRLFYKVNLTSEEAVAVLLHELGHNFDFSIYSIANGIVVYIQIVVNIMMDPTNINNITNGLMNLVGRGAFDFLTTLEIDLYNYVPPLGLIMRAYDFTRSTLLKLLRYIFLPISFSSIIVNALYYPLNYLLNILTRKQEVYADSFAAAFGYGSEISIALDKLFKYSATIEHSHDVNVFNDLALFQSEWINAFINPGHGTNQQRLKNMINKLHKDLNESGLSAADKKEIRKEISRLEDTYDDFINADPELRGALTAYFRKDMDRYINDSGNMFIDTTKTSYYV